MHKKNPWHKVLKVTGLKSAPSSPKTPGNGAPSSPRTAGEITYFSVLREGENTKEMGARIGVQQVNETPRVESVVEMPPSSTVKSQVEVAAPQVVEVAPAQVTEVAAPAVAEVAVSAVTEVAAPTLAESAEGMHLSDGIVQVAVHNELVASVAVETVAAAIEKAFVDMAAEELVSTILLSIYEEKEAAMLVNQLVANAFTRALDQEQAAQKQAAAVASGESGLASVVKPEQRRKRSPSTMWRLTQAAVNASKLTGAWAEISRIASELKDVEFDAAEKSDPFRWS